MVYELYALCRCDRENKTMKVGLTEVQGRVLFAYVVVHVAAARDEERGRAEAVQEVCGEEERERRVAVRHRWARAFAVPSRRRVAQQAVGTAFSGPQCAVFAARATNYTWASLSSNISWATLLSVTT